MKRCPECYSVSRKRSQRGIFRLVHTSKAYRCKSCKAKYLYVDFLKTMTTENIPTYVAAFRQASEFLQNNNVEEAQRIMNEMFSHMATVSNGLRTNPSYGQPPAVYSSSSLGYSR